MAHTLLDSARRLDDLQRVIVSQFANSSPILQHIPWKQINGLSAVYQREDKLPDTGFRGINGTYTESTGKFDTLTEPLSIFGGYIDIDRQILKSDPQARSAQTRMKLKSYALTFTKTFFDGNRLTNPKEFDGINIRLDGTSNVIPLATNGLQVSANDANMKAFLKKIREGIDATEAMPGELVLYMGYKTKRILDMICQSQSSFIWTSGQDNYDNRINFFDGIPVYTIGRDVSGNYILDFDETCGTSHDCSSIYVLRYGIDQYFGGIRNSEIDISYLGELPDKPVER